MAFVGNDMFGHGMTHHPTNLVHNGSHFGAGGFGSSSQKSTFGSGMSGSGGFGQGFGMSDGSHRAMNSNQPLFHRQNSLLTDMTHSKSDPKPVYVNEFNQSAVRHEDQIYSNMYEKPLEKPKPKPVLERRKTLTRQKSVCEDDFDRPPRLSHKTRSQSVSMYDDQDSSFQPMNMDLARPILRRSNTVSEKPNKSFKHKFLRPLSIGHKFRKRSDSRSSQSSTEPVRSEPPRSSKYREDLEIEVKASKSKSPPVPPDDEHERLILSLMNPPSSPETETKDNHRNKQSMWQPPVPSNLHSHNHEIPNNEIIESPTTVRRRFQHDKPPDQDNVSLTSGRSTPKSVHVISTPSLIRTLTIETLPRRTTDSPRRSPNHSPIPENKTKTFNDYKPEVVNTGKHQNYRSDSENSDVYYECENQEAQQIRTKQQGDRKRGKNKPHPEKPRACLLSSGTNSDDESSNPNSPRSALKGDPFHRYQNEEPSGNRYDESTLCVRKLIDTFNRKAEENAEDIPLSPTVKQVQPDDKDLVAALSFARHFGSDTEEEGFTDRPSRHINHSPDLYHARPPEIVIPRFENIIKGQEPNTAESSESGYTSNLQNSPRDFELKTAQYVNSLPDHSEKVNRKSTGSDLLRNGSQTDSDNESELSEVHCKSGSDTDYHLSETETLDESFSKLEVMKILESPSDIARRIQVPVNNKTNVNQVPEAIKVKKASIQTAPAPVNAKIIHSPTSPFIEKRSSLKNKNSQKSNDSETELKHLYINEPKSTKLVTETVNPENGKSDTVVVNTSKPGSPKITPETRLLSRKSTPSVGAAILDLPLLGFRKSRLSSVEQTQCTNCLDSLLHILNVILFISSAGVVGVGLWLLLKEFNVNHIADILGNNIILIIMYAAVGGAALALLAAMCLCCGVRRDKFGLGFYACVLVVVIFALATATLLCVILSEKLKGVEAEVGFKERLITKYGNTDLAIFEHKFFTESWDKMQREFECCGAYGNVNDTTSWAVYKKESAWYKLQLQKEYNFVPPSCCAANANIDVCKGSDHFLYGPPVYGPPMNRGFTAKNPNLNTNGCYEMVSVYLFQLLTITALVTGGLGGLYFLVVMLTWIFCFKRRTDPDYDYSSYDYYEDEVFDEEDQEEEDNEKDNERSALNTDNGENTDRTCDAKVHNKLTSEISLDNNTDVYKPPNEGFSDINSATGKENEERQTFSDRSNTTGTIPFYSDTPVNLVERIAPPVIDRISPHIIDRLSPHVIERISPHVMDRVSPGSEEEAIDRRNRYERSDSKLNQLFTETIEEEDSNFEDSDIEAPKDHTLSQPQLKGVF